jgi:hypothetical protein
VGIRFRFGKKVAFLKAETVLGKAQQLRLGNLFWSPTLGRKLGTDLTFRVAGIGREGFVPTVDVRPVAFNAA